MFHAKWLPLLNLGGRKRRPEMEEEEEEEEDEGE
jgi:hypothetical protein